MSFSKLFSRGKDKSSSESKRLSRAGGHSDFYQQSQSTAYPQNHYPPANPHNPPPYAVMQPGNAMNNAGANQSYFSGGPIGESSNPYQAPPPQAYGSAFPSLNNRPTFPLPTANPPPGADDPYSFLRNFDTVIVVDDSGSMAGRRWHETEAALATIVPIVTYYDSDGIDLYFLNQPDSPWHHNIKTPAQVMEIFNTVQPSRATPTGTALNRLLKPYLQKLKANPNKVKPMNIIVITDGEPTDDVESVIVQAARKLDEMDADLTQVGIQFFQVGNDPRATEALKELDDALGEMKNIRDMVDTVPFRDGFTLQGDAMLKVVLGAVNKRLDRKRV